MNELALGGLSAALVFLCLWKTDDTNAQIGVVPIALLALFTLVPGEARVACGFGLFVSIPAYAAFFVRQRGRRVPMPDYFGVDGVDGVAAPASVAAVAQSAPDVHRTPSTSDGPYYIPNTPHKQVLAAGGTPGQRMRFTGHVRTRDGAPVRGAAIEIWHADGNGDYDNEHYNCRGHQYTDEEGGFGFETVRPFGYGRKSLSMAGVVDYRSAHLHVKIRRDGETWTSQIWFPDDDDRNPTDIAFSRFAETNVVTLDREDGIEVARFDFVL